MPKRDIGLNGHERERLTGPPRDVSRQDFKASALVFCIVMLICALIAAASMLARQSIGIHAKPSTSPHDTPASTGGNGKPTGNSTGNAAVGTIP